MNSTQLNDINFINQLELALKGTLPGLEAQLEMASPRRLNRILENPAPKDAVESSILILLYPIQNTLSTVLIKRQSYDGVHSGQISFPGGRTEPDDKTFTQTALREAWEEVNIEPKQVQVLGELTPLYIPPSNFLVYPVVGFSSQKPDFIPQQSEVAEIIETGIQFIFDPEKRKTKRIYIQDKPIDAPCFVVNGHIVWGATAMILNELKIVIESMGL